MNINYEKENVYDTTLAKIVISIVIGWYKVQRMAKVYVEGISNISMNIKQCTKFSLTKLIYQTYLDSTGTYIHFFILHWISDGLLIGWLTFGLCGFRDEIHMLDKHFISELLV